MARNALNTGLALVSAIYGGVKRDKALTGSRRLPRTVSRNPLPSGRG